MKFKPNDRVEIVRTNDKTKEYVGKYGNITSLAWKDEDGDDQWDCMTDDGFGCHGVEVCFRLLYDGYKVVSWDDCLWIPEDEKQLQPS